MICSSCTHDHELENICSIFIDNDFPINFIKHTVELKIKRFKESIAFGSSLCSLHLKLPRRVRNSQVLSEILYRLLLHRGFHLWCQVLFLRCVRCSPIYLRMVCTIYKITTWYMNSKFQCDVAYIEQANHWKPVSVNTPLQLKEHITLVGFLRRPKQCMIQQSAPSG